MVIMVIMVLMVVVVVVVVSGMGGRRGTAWSTLRLCSPAPPLIVANANFTLEGRGVGASGPMPSAAARSD